MPTPQLVVTPTGFPSKTWPGGIISLRASDWLGDSAGASVESDSRAIEGEAVRETQQYSGHIDDTTGRNAGMTAMDDTLTIDLSLLTFTAKQQGSGDLLPMNYAMYLSLLIEGDWGTQITNYDHNPLRFDRACSLGVFGEGFYSAANDHATLTAYLRNCPQYRMFQLFDYLYFEDGDEVIHVRAFSRDITSIEFLIDQVIFLPLGDQWWGYDFTTVMGGENTTGITEVPVDGADGGDANGKFTWHPRNSPMEKTGGYEDGSTDPYGGGDYQQDDSEYMLEIVPEDEYTSDDAWNGGPNAGQHAYSIAGAYHRESEVYVEDDFARTIAAGSGWGSAVGPASGGGYKYSTSAGLFVALGVDGSRGYAQISGTGPRDDGGGSWKLPGAVAPGIFSSDFILSGKFEVAQAAGLSIWDGSTTDVSNTIGMTSALGGSDVSPGLVIQFDIMNAQWRVSALKDLTFTPISGWFDVSSWFTISDSGTLGDNEVGFKIDLRRFLLRVKVWDAGGSEPGTWDHEDFHPVWDNTVPGWVDYPYGDDGLLAAGWQQAQLALWIPQEMTPFASFGAKGYVAQWAVYWDDIKCEFDPDGDTANVNASIESPKGTEVGRIEVPSGAWHFVYWGRRQYAAVIDLGWGDTGALDFAQKVWSDAGAAELQRAELPITYFFGSLGGGIVSMNWSSALPADITRVHG